MFVNGNKISSHKTIENIYYSFMLHSCVKSPPVPIISCPNVVSDQKIDSFWFFAFYPHNFSRRKYNKGAGHHLLTNMPDKELKKA